MPMFHLSPDIESTKYGFEFAEIWKFPVQDSILLVQHGKRVSGEVNKANQIGSWHLQKLNSKEPANKAQNLKNIFPSAMKYFIP